MVEKITFQDPTKRKLGILLDEQGVKQAIDAWAAEDYRKLLLLCRQRNISEGPSMFACLALDLARELFPEPKKRGAKPKWDEMRKGCLVVEVERLANKDDSSHGIEWACTQLAKREPWLSFLTGGSEPAESLRAKYYESRDDKWANICRDAFELRRHEERLADWDEYVIYAVKKQSPIK